VWNAAGAIRVSARRSASFLASVYGWFTEGFDTRDLKEAKGLLEDHMIEQLWAS
jgi:hypothetical protein